MVLVVTITPVMYSDISGESIILAILAVGLTIWTAWDVYQIYQGELQFNPVNGDLENSHKVQNPATIFGYSLFLKYSSDNTEFFEGCAGGIAAEWIWHNILFDGSYLLEKIDINEFLGQDVRIVLNQSKTAGFGSSIFRDTVNNDSRFWVVIPSLMIEKVLFPISYRYDLYKEIIKREV